jgi:Flp pilus assembly secretin CpaC/tetratricopeptide (TPR) repeat protein
VEDTTLRTNKLLALLSAVLVACVFICPLQAQNTTQPDDPKVLFDKGLQAFQSYDFDQASILFRHARRIDNTAKKLSDEQRKQLDNLLDESAQGATQYRAAETSLAQGKTEMAKGNFAEARNQFNRVLGSEKYVPKSWVQEAKVQLGVLAKKSKAEPAKNVEIKASAEAKPACPSAPAKAPAKKEVAKPVAENTATKPVCDAAPKPVCPKTDAAVSAAQCPAVNAVPVRTAQPTILDEILAARNVQREQVLASFRDSESQIHQSIQEHSFLPARDTLRQVRQDILRARRLFDQAEMEQLMLQVDTLAQFIDTEEQTYQQQQVLLQAKEAELKRVQREQQVEQEKFDKIQKLFEEAVKLRREKKYTEAIDKAKQILDIEPNFDRAIWFIEDIQDMADYEHQRQISKNIDFQGRRAFTESDKVRISWVDEIQYPKNWQELAQNRDDVIRRLGKVGVGDTPSRITEKTLRQTFIENTEMFQGTIQDALKVFQGKDINVFVRWDVLEFEGISPDDEVKYDSLEAFKNISLQTILELLLSTMGPQESEINYAIDSNGVVVISTKSNLTSSNLTPRVGRLETRIYNIADLMMYHPTLSSIPEVQPTQEEESITQEGLEAKEFEDLTNLDDLVEYLLTLIQTVVSPTTWVEAGGEGSIDVWRHRWLIIYQTPENHDLIAGLLESMREVQSIQIALEARFVTISSNFLEKVGLDLDIIFNTGNAGYDFTGSQNNFGSTSGSSTGIVQPRQFSYLGALPVSPTGGAGSIPPGYAQPYGQAGLVPVGNGSQNNFTPIPMLNGSNQMAMPQDTSLPGNLANSFTQPAFQIMGAFMDDLQVNFLLEATQIDKYSSIVQAPRVVMENGSLGYISVQTDVPYVKEIEVTVGESAAGQAPTVEYLGFGTVLAVRAVTRDLKYVNMYVIPQITQPAPDANLRLSVPIVAPGSVGSTDYVYPGKRTTRVESVVSVPDGGTLLIGGLKQNGEITMEAGPPILSKMPVLKRFFANTSVTKDNFTLMVLVKPKIMVREEMDPELSRKLNIGSVPASSFEY